MGAAGDLSSAEKNTDPERYWHQFRLSDKDVGPLRPRNPSGLFKHLKILECRLLESIDLGYGYTVDGKTPNPLWHRSEKGTEVMTVLFRRSNLHSKVSTLSEGLKQDWGISTPEWIGYRRMKDCCHHLDGTTDQLVWVAYGWVALLPPVGSFINIFNFFYVLWAMTTGCRTLDLPWSMRLTMIGYCSMYCAFGVLLPCVGKIFQRATDHLQANMRLIEAYLALRAVMRHDPVQREMLIRQFGSKMVNKALKMYILRGTGKEPDGKSDAWIFCG